MSISLCLLFWLSIAQWCFIWPLIVMFVLNEYIKTKQITGLWLFLSLETINCSLDYDNNNNNNHHTNYNGIQSNPSIVVVIHITFEYTAHTETAAMTIQLIIIMEYRTAIHFFGPAKATCCSNKTCMFHCRLFLFEILKDSELSKSKRSKIKPWNKNAIQNK